MADLNSLLNPRTIAVVGAAREDWKVGHIIFKNLFKIKHLQVFPVNPNAFEILGEKCYNDLAEIPYSIDCVIISVKAEIVPDVMKQAAKKKVKSVIVVSAGFSEAGNPLLEEVVRDIAKNAGITLLGPNSFGFVNPYAGINTTFYDKIPEKGKIAFLSQSGAIGVAALDMAVKEKTGFSGFVSIGNSALLDFSDFIEHYSQDKNTEVIALYIEGIKEGRGKRFIEVCKKCKKKIIVLKSGKSKKGSQAAQSHTASLASEAGVYESVFKQAGIAEVESISELFAVSNLFIMHKNLGKRACIVTNAGGLGVLCTDSCEKNRIEMVSIPENIREKLKKILPEGAATGNPIDIIGDALAERYKKF